MKKILFVPVLVLAASVVYSQGSSSAVSYESLTIADTAKVITSSTLSLVMAYGSCVGRLETAQVRFRTDGTAPTTEEGLLLNVGDIITIRGLTNLVDFKAIRTGSTSGVLKLQCYQGP